MKGFKNSTKMTHGHGFAKGGHVPRPHFAQSSPVSAKPANDDTVNGLTARSPDMAGNAAVKRKIPTTAVEEAHGGKSDVESGYKGGGKVVHVHQHYHNGKRMPSKRQMDAKRRKAEGGLIGSGTAGVKLGRNAQAKPNGKASPSRSGFATGGTIDKLATGGTIDKMQCGGAMYAGGGGVKGSMSRHENTPAPRGHKGLGSMIRRGG